MDEKLILKDIERSLDIKKKKKGYYSIDGNKYDRYVDAEVANEEYWYNAKKMEILMNSINDIYYKYDESADSTKKINDLLLNIINYIGKSKISFANFHNYYNLFLNLNKLSVPVDCLNDFAIALSIVELYPTTGDNERKYREYKMNLSNYIDNNLMKTSRKL